MPYINGGGGGGGGSTSPAGSNTQVQFNNNGAFGASARLLWDDNVGLTVKSTVKLSTTPNGAANIVCEGAGAELRVAAADGDATHVGGETTITSGDSAGNNGGDITLTAGSDTADGTGGNVTIESGHSSAGDGGEVAIRANGTSNVPGQGGQVAISGGSGVSGGGDVIVQGGSTNGSVQVYSGDSNQYVQLDNGGLQIGATKLGFFQAAPVVQQTLVSGTATPEQIALALQAATLMGGT